MPALPLVVVFTREYGTGFRAFDDGNLPPAFKHAQDGVADWLFGHGKSDQREGLAWRYVQAKREGVTRCTMEVRVP